MGTTTDSAASSRRATPTLPGAPNTTPRVDQGGESATDSVLQRRVDTTRRLGYRGVVPPMLPSNVAKNSSTESADAGAAQARAIAMRAAIAESESAPSTNVTDGAIEDPAERELSPPSEVGDAAPVDPFTGLPLYATGEVTPTPNWRRTQPTRARRRAAIPLLIALVATLGAVIWAGFGVYKPSEGAPPEDPTISDTPAVPEVPDTPKIRPEVATLLDELALDERDGPLPPPDPSNYGFTWVDQFGFRATVLVDTATGDFLATTEQDAELRRVGDRSFGRSPNGPWIELSAEASEAIPDKLLEGPLSADDVLPPAVSRFVVAEGGRGILRSYLIDDAGLADENPAARERWLAPWGLLADFKVPEPVVRTEDVVPGTAAAGDVLLFVTTGNEGVVSAVVLSTPAIGGTTTYRRIETGAIAPVIEIPEPLTAG